MRESAASLGGPSPPLTWQRVAILAALPAFVLGILLYPDIQQRLMPSGLAVLVLAGVAALVIATGRGRCMIVVPVVAAFLPALQAGFAAYLMALAYFGAVYGARRLLRPLDRYDWALLAVLAWLSTSWIYNIGIETDVWSFPIFALTFLAPWLLIFLARAADWEPDDWAIILAVLLGLTVSQAVPALLKPMLLRVPGAYSVPLQLLEFTNLGILRAVIGGGSSDQTFGTTPSAHHLGVVLLTGIGLLIALAVVRRRRPPWPVLVVLTYVFLMTDSKHIILAAVPSAIAFLAVVLLPLLSGPSRRRVAVIAIVGAVGAGVWLMPRIASTVNRVWKPYVSLATFNPKVQLIDRTLERLREGDLSAWIGLGPGSYATRAATIRATDVLFKDEDRLPSIIPSHTGRSYRSAAYDLYTSEIALTARFRSGVLTNPFSSLIGILAEFGILGVGVFGWLLFEATRLGARAWGGAATAEARAAGIMAALLVPMFLLLGIFDSYFEQPDLTGIIATLVVIASASAGPPLYSRSMP